MKFAKDKQFAAELKATLLQDQLVRAEVRAAAAERFAVKLLTQFSTVEAVFAEAKAMALEHAAAQPEIKDERLPEVTP